MSYRSGGSAEPREVECLVRPGGMVTEVWLRRNAESDVADSPDGTGTEFWEWDENHLVLPGALTEADVDADALWERAEAEALTDREYAEALDAATGDALADLSEAVSDNALSLSDISDALAELSQVVSDNTGSKEA